jgi:GT2 family glycosyltransferase
MASEPTIDPWSRVAVVTVCHHSGAVIADCLRSLGAASRIVVVDNASGDDTVAVAAAARPEVLVIENSENLGFGVGCNLGLEQVDAEFVLLINPDARLEPGALERLVAAADTYLEAAWLGPALRRPDGGIETSHDVALFDSLKGHTRSNREPPPEGDICAGFVSGAVALLRRAAVERVGGFDSAILLYYEDDDLGLRLCRAGYSLVRVADAVARHLGGRSTPDHWRMRWRKDWHMSWSRLHVERKHRGLASCVLAALPMLGRRGGKALVYALVLKSGKARRDAARFAGALAYCLGIRAAPKPSRQAKALRQ